MLMNVEIQGSRYELVRNHKNGWNPEVFGKRYSEVLKKYDYIVGDWGYGQLRLKGFFSDQHPKATRETRITHFEEYIHEYCNFGCAYFVLRRVRSISKKTRSKDRRFHQKAGDQ
ncbi:YutD family protein [Kroppenstedtia pulmonis]|uniref:YutD family protein n=2 Tax=Kroppenstedtia pulmonis TaxID=1380685 RepID=A0A7D3XZM6_9BACL|nr:YutD family protein [Kroppenstedtia pulmonis]